jgi:hypothetical protein
MGPGTITEVPISFILLWWNVPSFRCQATAVPLESSLIFTLILHFLFCLPWSSFFPTPLCSYGELLISDFLTSPVKPRQQVRAVCVHSWWHVTCTPLWQRYTELTTTMSTQILFMGRSPWNTVKKHQLIFWWRLCVYVQKIKYFLYVRLS